ncbi:hypothetical protein B5807_11013 [Epicoccum nigrum]|uniref:Uncharacterized protein n=1 Tax=Epicoccum nigrum TaxID=105696 RepID=A0A1Y2LLB2_EPING|nr:hypothetical protein B5807_11013 [Epicoccum nigrum]
MARSWSSITQHIKPQLPAAVSSHEMHNLSLVPSKHTHSPNGKTPPSAHVNRTHPHRVPPHPLPDQFYSLPFPLILSRRLALILASTSSHTQKLPHTTPYKRDKRIMGHRRHQSSLIPHLLLTKPGLVKEQVGARREKCDGIQPNNTPNSFVEETREPRWDYGFIRALDFCLITVDLGRCCVAHETAT